MPAVPASPAATGTARSACRIGLGGGYFRIRVANPKGAPFSLVVGDPCRTFWEEKMAATKDKAKAKGRAVKATAPKPERRDGRYLRAARVIIAEGDGVDLAELAAKAGLSPASSAYCLEAFRGVTQALREAKMLASRPAGIVIYGCPLHCKRF
jgi:hypothetical protein